MATKSKSKGKSKTPGHYTESGTRKFQANGPQEWGKTFRAAAKAMGEGREGKGIMMAMAYAVAHDKAFVAWVGKQAATKVDVKPEGK
jgi:hypothetical protein